MKQIEIYTDGSCRGNPGPGGWAAIFLEKNTATHVHVSSHASKHEHAKKQKLLKILKGSAADTTNNRMEMTAVIEALRYIDEHNLHAAEITLYSDSNLVIQTLLQGWKRKANLDLWEELDELGEELDVTYVWIKGHAKNYWNNECDKVAQNESLHAQKKASPARGRHVAAAPGPARSGRRTSKIQQELF